MEEKEEVEEKERRKRIATEREAEGRREGRGMS